MSNVEVAEECGKGREYAGSKLCFFNKTGKAYESIKQEKIRVNGKEEQPEWDESSKTLLLSFENDPAGVNVSIEW